MLHRIILFILLATLSACSQPDPKPELKDPIYQDIAGQMALVEKGIADLEKKRLENVDNLKKVTPQTGQIKYAEKRVWDSERALQLLKQQQKYWMIRLDQRRDFVRKKSLESFAKGEKWEDSAELDAYNTEKRLRLARLQWDARERRELFLKETGLDPSSAAKAQKSTTSQGGGH